MTIKKPIPITFNLDSHNSVQSVCAVIHIDDKNTETLDLSLMQGGEHIAVSQNSTVTARFVRVKNNTLISDDIACTVQENGNIYIPIDNAAAHMLVGEIKIEVNIVDENDVLTMQFPLVIRVNNTILADAEICPISKGTIPELIEKAQETADNAQETADNAQQTADNAQAAASTAQQTASSAQTAANSAQQTADNAIAGLGNKQDTLTAGENITIEGNVISASSGSNDYTDLINKPSINNVTLSGNKSSDDLNLQGKLTAGTNITIDEIGRISATGGVTDYNDLTNKPRIGFTGQIKTLNGILDFYFGDFTGEALPNGVSISLRENVFKSVLSPTYNIPYNFNAIASNLLLTGVYKIRKIDMTNLPQEFSNAGQVLYVFHYLTTKTYSDLIRMVTYETVDGVKVWIQLATLGGTDESGNTLVNTFTAWTDLSNQIGYTLTEQDKQDIADIVLSELPTTEGVLYGNQSN